VVPRPSNASIQLRTYSGPTRRGYSGLDRAAPLRRLATAMQRAEHALATGPTACADCPNPAGAICSTWEYTY
jgi:hypothetical protein